MGLLDSGDYDAGYALLMEIGNSDAVVSNKYDRAVALIDSGDYETAYKLLDGLEYKDSADKRKLIEESDVWVKLCPVGSTCCFGSYEQDNDISNGKEDIEWLVLEKEDDRILVVSKYGLNCRNYDNTIIDTTWKSSDIRTWLNTEFRETAFGPDELGRIPAVSSADDRSTFIETGEAMDFVFLLHRDYLEDYRGLALSEPCFPTAYNLSQGCFTDEENGACKWWLRVDDATYNPDFGDDTADFAYCRNFTIASGNIFDKDISVRPAIWIDLTAF